MQLKNAEKYHKTITQLYDDKQLDEKDMESLDVIKRDLSNSYSVGKLRNERYNILNNEISKLYREVFRKRIDFLNSLPANEDQLKLRNNIRSDLDNAYANEKLNEKHYTLLKNSLSKTS